MHTTPADQALADQALAQMTIAEMAGLLRDIRGGLAADGCMLAGIAVGAAVEAARAAGGLRPTPIGLMNLGLFGLMLTCWLAAVGLLVRSSRPVLSTVNELRWVTGAPLDARPGWLTLPPAGANPADWTLNRAHLLLAAARLARHRMQFADTWTYLTAGCFLAWLATSVIGMR